MKKLLLTMASVLTLMVSMLAANAFAAKKPKIDICHQTGADKFMIINVSENAADAHFAHSSIGHEDPTFWRALGDGSCEADVGVE